MDPPNDINDVQKIKDWLDKAGIHDKNTALYFPRIKIADQLNEFRLRSFGASGTIAGLYARTDSNRGVWKAPAGTEATLVNVQALDYKLTDAQNGTLNPLAINCLRNFPDLWKYMLGDTHSGWGGSESFRVEVYPCPSAGTLHRRKPLQGHTVGGFRAKR